MVGCERAPLKFMLTCLMLSMLSSLISLRSIIDIFDEVETDVFICLLELISFFIFLLSSEGKYSPNVGAISKKIGGVSIFYGDLHR